MSHGPIALLHSGVRPSSSGDRALASGAGSVGSNPTWGTSTGFAGPWELAVGEFPWSSASPNSMAGTHQALYGGGLGFAEFLGSAPTASHEIRLRKAQFSGRPLQRNYALRSLELADIGSDIRRPWPGDVLEKEPGEPGD